MYAETHHRLQGVDDSVDVAPVRPQILFCTAVTFLGHCDFHLTFPALAAITYRTQPALYPRSAAIRSKASLDLARLTCSCKGFFGFGAAPFPFTTRLNSPSTCSGSLGVAS